MTLPVRPPVKPMLAKIFEVMPEGDDWIYEPKWDGFRTLVFRDGDDIELRSRKDRPMNRYFPEMESLLLERLPERCVLDGEIIIPSDEGLQFEWLQLRLHPAESRVKKLAAETPTSFVGFDVLAIGDEDLRTAPLSERLARLTDLFGADRPDVARDPATTPGSRFYLTPCTDDASIAADWFEDLERVHLDGIIAKKLSLPYREDERVMIKIKHRRTADCVVIGFRRNPKGALVSLLLGLYEGEDLRYVGHTSSGSAADRKAAMEILAPLEAPAPASLEGDWGPGAQSRWSSGRPEYEWVSVEPKIVVEVSYDFMQGGYRFRHAARFMRWRDDKEPADCTFEQVQV
ncbi:MAG: ATP-dependent DNA ligase [Actinomycetota bacterium]